MKMNEFASLQQQDRKLRRKTSSDQPEDAVKEVPPEVIKEIEVFIKECCQAGKHISDEKERDFLRTALRYWAVFVYDETGTYPSVTLDELEPSISKRHRFTTIARVIMAAVSFLLLGALFARLAITYLSPRPSLLADIAPQLAQVPSAAITSDKAWPSEAFAVQYCGCDKGDVHRGVFSAKVNFTSSPQFWGIWGISVTEPFDASKFERLSFWVKGDKDGDRFQIKLQYLDADNKSLEKYVISTPYVSVNTSWQAVSIPLDDFVRQGVVLERLQALWFGFNEDTGSTTVFIDDIGFETQR